MDDIVSFFYDAMSNNDEKRNYATNAIYEMRTNPNNIFYLFEIIMRNFDDNIKIYSTIQIKEIFEMHFEEICGDQNNINQILLEIHKVLTCEALQNNSTIAHNFMESISLLIKNGIGWETLLEYISPNPDTIMKIYVLLEIVNYLNEETIHPFTDVCLKALENSMNTSDYNFMIICSKIFARITHILPDECANELGKYLLFCLGNPFKQDCQLANSVSMSFDINHRFFVPNEILKILFKKAEEHDSNIQALSIPIKRLIKLFWQELDISFHDIAQCVLNFSSVLYTEGCYDEQSDALFILQIIIEYLKKVPESLSIFIPFLKQNFTDKLDLLFSVAGTVQLMAKENPRSLLSYKEDIVQFLLYCLSVDNHTIIELALYCIFDLNEDIPDYFKEWADRMFEILLQLEIKDETMLEIMLNCVARFLFFYNIKNTVVSSMVQNYVHLAYNYSKKIKASIIYILCGIIISLGKEITYVDQISELLLKNLEDEDEDFQVKSRSLEALGALIYSGNDLECSFLEKSIKYIIDYLSSDDPSIIQSSIQALIYIAKSDKGVDPFIEIALINIFKLSTTILCNESDEAYNFEDIIPYSFKFFNAVLKNHPNACQRWVPFLASYSIKCMNTENTDIAIAATKTAVYTSLIDENSSEIYLSLKKNLESKKIKIAASGFKGISKILKKKTQIPLEALHVFIDFSLYALNHQLKCQISKNKVSKYSKVINPALTFLQNLAECMPDLFPFETYYNYLSQCLQNNVSRLEYENCLLPILSYVKTVKKHELFNQLLNLTLPLLENCETNIPMELIKQILTENPEYLTPEIQSIFL